MVFRVSSGLTSLTCLQSLGLKPGLDKRRFRRRAANNAYQRRSGSTDAANQGGEWMPIKEHFRFRERKVSICSLGY